MPPRHGKSTLTTHWFPFHHNCVFPEEDFILAGYGDAFVSEWGEKLLRRKQQFGGIFNHQLIKATASLQQWRGYSGMFRCAGVGGGIMGRGGHVIIVDDPIKSAEEARSPTYRKRLSDYFHGTLYNRLEPGGALGIIMTRWDRDDIVGELMEASSHGGEEYVYLELPAIAGVHDPLGRDIGQALWPERYDEERLAQIRLAVGPYWWASVYQQRPLSIEGTKFRKEQFRYYDIRHEGAKQFLILHHRERGDIILNLAEDVVIFQTVDLAFKTREQNDWTVIATWAMTRDRMYLALLDLDRKRVEGADHLDMVRTNYDKWQPSYVGIESVQAQVTLVQQAQRLWLPAFEVNVPGDKVLRSLVASAAFGRGSVFMPSQSPYLQDYEDELTNFPTGAHDDQVDVTSLAARLALEIPLDSGAIGTGRPRIKDDSTEMFRGYPR